MVNGPATRRDKERASPVEEEAEDKEDEEEEEIQPRKRKVRYPLSGEIIYLPLKDALDECSSKYQRLPGRPK